MIFSFRNTKCKTRGLLVFYLLISFSWISLIADQRKVLFLGNSYTSVNNLPQLIFDVAGSMNDTLIFDSHSPGGYTLDQHFSDTNSTNKIKIGGWDFVVLQEQSQLPSFEDYYSAGGNWLCQMIRQYNPCARKMFYMTWGRKNGDSGNCAIWPPVCTYEGMDSLLRLRYIESAIANGTDMSPVGAVWRYLRQNFPNIELYQADESHPSAAGSYAAAFCFYSALFKKDPSLSNFNSVLNQAEAAIIRDAVKVVVYDSLQYWDFSKHFPDAEFSYVIGQGTNEVVCTNSTTNADTYSWDFGDGLTSVDTTVFHNYSSNGTYTIMLSASRCDLTQMHQDTFSLDVTFCQHNPTILPDELVLCPNSSDTLWTQNYDSYQWYNDGILLPGETNQFLVPAYGSMFSVIANENGCSELSPAVFVNNFNPGLVIYRVDTLSHFPFGDTLCYGDTLILVLNTNRPDNSGNQIQWSIDGQDIPSAVNDTFLITASGTYLVNVKNSVCPDYAIFLSPPINFTFLNCNAGIDEGDELQLMDIYPNPSHESIQIKINPQLLGEHFSIYDMFGKEVLNGLFESEITALSIINFTKGVYFIKTDLPQVGVFQFIFQ